MRLVFMGSPEFAVLPLRYLAQEGHVLAAVYTKLDKPVGRGMALGISPVKREALALGLPVIQPKTLKNPETQKEMSDFHPEVIIVCAYGQILPKAVLNLPKYGCLNIHPSLLPRHRGASPAASTILCGDKWGGATIMLLDEGLDTGPVLSQAQVLVRGDDTAGSLIYRLSIISARLLVDIIPEWVKGRINPQPQDNALATCFKTITKEAGEIDWSIPSEDIERRVRAFQPWPGSYSRYQGKIIKILAARVACPEVQGVPGTVVTSGKGFGVKTGSGVLEITRVQLEGKQAVSGEEFARGQRNLVGSVLPS